MTGFQPFEIDGEPMEQQFMNWNAMIQTPYDTQQVDAYTRTRVILMNGIENNSILTSHALCRMIGNDDIKRTLGYIRRADSQQQQMINWLIPSNQSVLETTIAYEQAEVDLTADLAQHEPDNYIRQVLDFALLEDFDHLFRYGCLLQILEDVDPYDITQGKTEIKPGRPIIDEHRHPFDALRRHYDKDKASLKTKMNCHTIVSAEQQTMLYYKAHGNRFYDDMARKLYAEIAEIEEEHVSQYELVGDPRESPLEKMALLQLCEAYNYYSCAMTETDERLREIWARCCEMEITHFTICAALIKDFEKRDIMDILKTETIEPLIAFHSNKDYINNLLKRQVDLQPLNMEFVSNTELPKDWASFGYRDIVNAGGVPSEEVVARAEREGKLPKAA